MDDTTIGDATTIVLMNEDGACARHPHIWLREKAADGFVYQKESCPACDAEFHLERISLKEKRADLDRQLKELEDSECQPQPESIIVTMTPTTNGNNPSESKMERNSLRDTLVGYSNTTGGSRRLVQEDLDEHRPPPHLLQSNNNNNSNCGQFHGIAQSQQTMQSQTMQSAASNSSHFDDYRHNNTFSFEALASQMNRMQQMQDWILTQKERDLSQLRLKVEDQQQLIMEKEVQIALLKERLLQQEQRMQQELKLIKLAALSGRGKNKGKEIHIQELHVSVAAGVSADGSIDPDAVKQATAAATTAAIQNARDITKKALPSLPPSQEKNQHHSNAIVGPSNTPKRFESMGEPPAKLGMMATTTSARPLMNDQDNESSLEDIYNDHDSNQDDNDEEEEKEDPQEIIFAPNKERRSEEDFDEMEKEDAFDMTVTLAPAVPKNMSKKPQIQQPLQNANDHRKDPMMASNSSLVPSARDHGEKPSGSGGLPTRAQLNAAGKAETPRGVSIPKGLEFTEDGPPLVPLQEEVTVGTMDQENYLKKYDDYDIKSMGNTVASSTYGEDRQKVASQNLLDPYGDKGKFSGIVLRSTGMPHGLGRMVYEDDGRTYEGDWRHGRWHGYGRATFANGDSYEGEYRFDQRHGRGIYCWSDRRVYDGSFSEDKRHGKGTFKWPDGATYEGDFVQGQREGHGQYTFSDGGYYVGSWVDGRYEGFGECHWEDGRTYKGEWRAGMAHGQGVETYPDGRVRHDGLWQTDEPIRS